MKQIFTMSQLVDTINENYANPKALVDYQENNWRECSTRQMFEEIKYVALALYKMGLRHGDRVGIIAPPSSRWVIVDLAIMSTGLVTVPLFANISDENFHYEIEQTNPGVFFINGEEPWRRYEQNKSLFNNVISLESTEGAGSAGSVISYNEILEIGKNLDEEQPNLYNELKAAVKPDDIATIIYTSGSTGTPKGAIHPHYSLTANLIQNPFHFNAEKDVYLNILPLAHIFARTTYFVLIFWGVRLYFWNDIKNFAVACREIHPTLMIVVPRLLEKIYSRMVERIQTAGYMKRAIGKWAFDLANQEEPSTWKNLFHPLAERLVYAHLREAIGGRLRIVFSGGAPLDPHLNHFFVDIGLPVYEGWGMTEGCPAVVNTLINRKIGTVGKPLTNIHIKISPQGEILFKGTVLMRGYYKNDEATAQAFDDEGWFHTGDKGSLDEEGYMIIEGRLKDLMKTSQGEMIAPIPMEHALTKAPFVESAMIIAEKRRFVACLLVPDFEILRTIKQEQGMDLLSDEEFLDSTYIKKEMVKILDQINTHLNHWEKIHAYRFIGHPLSIEKGELTPSLKIVRKMIEEKYKGLIDAMYEEVLV